jgi:hypothetical protein
MILVAALRSLIAAVCLVGAAYAFGARGPWYAWLLLGAFCGVLGSQD